MRANLICYSLGKANPVTRTKLQRELHGYKDISNNGKYIYQRKGLVQTTKSKKILDSIILTDKNNVDAFVKLLKKYKAKTYVFVILIADRH